MDNTECDDLYNDIDDELLKILTPLFEYRFIMVGGSYYTGAASKTYNRMEQGEELFLVRQPDNAYDKNAIAVCTEPTLSFIVGYVPRKLAAQYGPIMDKAIKLIKTKSTAKQKDTIVLTGTLLRDERYDLIEISGANIITDYNDPIKK